MYRKIMVGYKPGERGDDALALAKVLASAAAIEDLVVNEEHDGSAAEKLIAAAEREEADVLVLGSTHRGFAGRVLRGTTAGSILPEAGCAVVVAPVGYAGNAAPLHEIAVAFDGSDEARAALEWAVALAAAVSARLRLVGVVAPTPPIDTWGSNVPGETWVSGFSGSQVLEIEDAQRERMNRELAAVAESAGAETTTATVIGNPAQELRAAAEEVDMLVVGSHRRGPLSAALFGSVSRGLAHSCPAPLAVIPTGDE